MHGFACPGTVFLQIRHMDPNLYCVLLLAKMKNGKLQVASNYPEVGSQFITSELALRFANCTNEGNVFKDQTATVSSQIEHDVLVL